MINEHYIKIKCIFKKTNNGKKMEITSYPCNERGDKIEIKPYKEQVCGEPCFLCNDDEYKNCPNCLKVFIPNDSWIDLTTNEGKIEYILEELDDIEEKLQQLTKTLKQCLQ